MNDDVITEVSSKKAWRMAAILIACLLLFTLILYQQTTLYLLALWNPFSDAEYGHGYLVLIISGYLVFYNRENLAMQTPCPEFGVLFFLLLAVMLWVLATLVGIEAVQAIALLLLIIIMVWALLGSRAMRWLIFPLLYISFAIPVWFLLSPFLQEITADVVFWAIRVMEIPAMREENTIILPAGKLLIEEACSGLRYLLAALTLGALYAYLNFKTFRGRLLVIFISVVAAVFANSLRVLVVVYLAYKTDMQHPFVSDHLSLGWYIFAGVLAVLLFADVCLNKASQQECSTSGKDEAIALSCSKNQKKIVIHAFIVVSIVAAGAGTIFLINNQPQLAVYQKPEKLMLTSNDWLLLPHYEDDWTPKYKGAISQKMVFQNQQGQKIQLFLGIYPTQKQGEEVINDLNRITDGRTWRTLYQKEKLVDAGKYLVLEQLLKDNSGVRRLVWYWYRVAKRTTVNKYQAKVYQVLGLLQGRQQASVIAIATKFDGEVESSRHLLSRFIEQVGSPIEKIADGGE
ncbi:Eight transmembrane protein EpsH / EpsI protein [hydrothermal vent metagenome]|uniref:Eight transmembrane protein EpsH / EpsI protein n=1 Tax=hydrothermal vent metagenome TaxID=652676 RepID=A0A3B0WFX1_9ZZZZ